MKFYSTLFDSNWRERGDAFSQARQQRHYDSLAEQVMASRNEVLHLQSEINRLSGDLAQTLLLNRVLVKLLLREGVCTPESLEMALGEALQNGASGSTGEAPSRFCTDCGRPLARPGLECCYCTELQVEAPFEESPATDEPVLLVSSDQAVEAESSEETDESSEEADSPDENEQAEVGEDSSVESDIEETDESEAEPTVETTEKPAKKKRKGKKK